MRDMKFNVYFLTYQRHQFLDKVWRQGPIFKLEQNRISGKLLRLIKVFVIDRKQRVVLNGQCSYWMNFQARVPQGSILEPLPF